MASTNDRTLTSYLSLLMTSGLSAWDNPTIDRATAVSDFDFSTFRRKPQTVYLVVSPDNIRPLAPLIRLFFSDLIASLQDHEPGEDEPWPVMIMLDEFDRLGKMPIVAESIKTLRSYGGHLAIITQTIPALDEIYGENTRLSLQGGAGGQALHDPLREAHGHRGERRRGHDHQACGVEIARHGAGHVSTPISASAPKNGHCLPKTRPRGSILMTSSS